MFFRCRPRDCRSPLKEIGPGCLTIGGLRAIVLKPGTSGLNAPAKLPRQSPSLSFVAMFSSSICASLVALIASAVIVSAAPGLTLKTSIPNVNVDGLESLKVITTVTNTGDETLKLLNDPRGVLESFPENSFTITAVDGGPI